MRDAEAAKRDAGGTERGAGRAGRGAETKLPGPRLVMGGSGGLVVNAGSPGEDAVLGRRGAAA